MFATAAEFSFAFPNELPVLSAGRRLAQILGADEAISRRSLNEALGATFGGTDADARWSTSDGHAALEPSTQRAAQHYRKNILESAFPSRFLDEIGHADAVRWHAGVTRSNGPGAANRAMEFLRAAFNKAELWGYIAEHSNPFCGIKANRQRKIERYLTDDEMARIGAALRNPCRADQLPATAILLLALTGCRRGEILDLTWSEVRGRRLVLRDTKTGPRIVRLGIEARGLLDRLPRDRNEVRVFPVSSFVNQVTRCWRRAKHEAGISNLRLHDLRHSYASFAVRQSESLIMIGGLLGHAKVGTSQRYAHLDDATLLEGSDSIGLKIDTWMGGRSALSSSIRIER